MLRLLEWTATVMVARSMVWTELRRLHRGGLVAAAILTTITAMILWLVMG
jgi:hypothetical protein